MANQDYKGEEAKDPRDPKWTKKGDVRDPTP